MTRFHRILLIIFGIPTAYFVYKQFAIEKSEYSYLLIPLGMIISVCVVFRDQIDSWYLRKNKPEMDGTLKRILEQKVFNYSGLFTSTYNPEDLLIYTFDCEFIGQGFDSIPDDLKHIVTAHAFYFGNELHKKWPSHYNRVVFYKHPFITPTIEHAAHSVEHDDEDGVLIFSLEQALPGIDRKGAFYNVILHGFADAFLGLYPPDEVGINEEEIWSRLLHAIGVNKDSVSKIIGLDQVNPYAVIAHYYVYQPEKILFAFPELKTSLFDNMNVSSINE